MISHLPVSSTRRIGRPSDPSEETRIALAAAGARGVGSGSCPLAFRSRFFSGRLGTGTGRPQRSSQGFPGSSRDVHRRPMNRSIRGLPSWFGPSACARLLVPATRIEGRTAGASSWDDLMRFAHRLAFPAFINASHAARCVARHVRDLSGGRRPEAREARAPCG
jgi:hypothetical protein